MAVRMYSCRLFNKLSSHLKFVSCVRNYSEKENLRSLKDNCGESSITVNILAYLHRRDTSIEEMKASHKWKMEQKLREKQRLVPERQKILGPDLNAAHFITACDGRVKFFGSDVWLTRESIFKKEIPDTFVPKLHLEVIDASDTVLCYEGLENLSYLPYIKEVILRNCPLIDDWCLHRLNMFDGSLERLDISGCQNVSDKGICTLHSFKNLKVLTMEDTPKIANKELVCLLLQDILPQLKIIGIDYSNPSLWERLQEYLN